MTISDQQLRAITYLALACRPTGAARWDEAGTYANLVKVRDRSLGLVIIAAVQAAEDRKVVSPGVIPKPGPHWRTPDAGTHADVIPFDRTRVCAICNRPESQCREVAARIEEEPHAFESVAASRARQAAPAPASPSAATKDDAQ
jgi:hypothetical protein